mgnify:CR=1 FL=1
MGMAVHGTTNPILEVFRSTGRTFKVFLIPNAIALIQNRISKTISKFIHFLRPNCTSDGRHRVLNRSVFVFRIEYTTFLPEVEGNFWVRKNQHSTNLTHECRAFFFFFFLFAGIHAVRKTMAHLGNTVTATGRLSSILAGLVCSVKYKCCFTSTNSFTCSCLSVLGIRWRRITMHSCSTETCSSSQVDVF